MPTGGTGGVIAVVGEALVDAQLDGDLVHATAAGAAQCTRASAWRPAVTNIEQLVSRVR